MSGQTIKVKVFRSNDSKDQKPAFQVYAVPFEEGMSAMNALDYIYQNLDSTVAYYDHAGCVLGICGRCTGKVNGKVGLMCQARVKGDITLEPASEAKVLKDLVLARSLERDSADSTEKTGDIKMTDINGVPVIIRREIEALITVPMLKAFIEEFGREKTMQIAENVTRSLASETGRLLKAMAGGNSTAHLQKALPLFSQGGALEFKMVESSPTKVAINVTKCKYADMYREHNLQEFGYLLSCGRDTALMEGFNPDIKFSRTQTIMQGADYCDFCFLTREN